MLTVELEPRPLFPTALANETTRCFFTCKHCFQEFKREDHLHRHELSHEEPRYRCSYPACNKAFRRKDVLKRHHLVHKPGPPRRRRWSKDKTIKHSLDSKACGTAQEAPSAAAVCGPSSDNISNAGIQASKISSPLLRNVVSLDSFERCCQVAIPGVPFVHLSTVEHAVAPELQLAIAVVGARKLDATGAKGVSYFSEAHKILQDSPHTVS